MLIHYIGAVIAYSSKSKSSLPRANEGITASEVRLIDAEGTMLGVFPIEEAIRMTKAKTLDLVELSPNAEPPVCKMMSFGKYKYELQKKASVGRKKQKTVQLKEIKLRPTIDKHDLEVKIRSIERFISDGHKVKISVRFRGREITHQDVAHALLARVKEAVQEYAKVELQPKMEARQLIMVLAGLA